MPGRVSSPCDREMALIVTLYRVNWQEVKGVIVYWTGCYMESTQGFCRQIRRDMKVTFTRSGIKGGS